MHRSHDAECMMTILNDGDNKLMVITTFNDGAWCCITLATGPRRSLNLNLFDTRVYEPQIRVHQGASRHDQCIILMMLNA